MFICSITKIVVKFNLDHQVRLKPADIATVASYTLETRNEPHYEKTGFLHMRKQRRRSAVR